MRTASIIICTRNNAVQLSKTLETVGRLIIPLEVACELMVIDNAAPDRGACNAAYRSGLGCAEVPVKYPATKNMSQIDRIIRVSGHIMPDDSPGIKLKKLAKQKLGHSFSRNLVLQPAIGAQSIAPRISLPKLFYDGMLGLNFSAGVQGGLKQAWAKSF